LNSAVVDLFSSSLPRNVLPAGGEAWYWGPLFPAGEADACFGRLRAEIPWQQDEVVVFGKKRVTARKVSWHGDPGCAYTYAGRCKSPRPWTDSLSVIKEEVESVTGVRFNSCLLNLYHSGAEGMGWHSDDEPELGPEPVIASLSFGAVRRFLFRHRTEKTAVELRLEHGSLLVMRGACQRFWQHSLPKALRIREPRINLTFRQIALR
jgi:alkylated DNA repair dioxygenase AlkB